MSSKHNKLANKHILIIGGTRGIGHGIATLSLSSSSSSSESSSPTRITISGSSPQTVQTAVQSLKDTFSNHPIIGIPCDLSDPTTLESNLETLFTRAAEQNGEIDHVVYTAADNLTLVPVRDLTVETISSAAQMRLTAPLIMAKVAQRHLHLAAKGGQVGQFRDKSIILTTGSIAHKPNKDWSLIAYFATGLIGMTRNLALDLSPIRVNIVEPGVVNTSLWDAAFNSVEEREAYLNKEYKHLPVGKPAAVEEVAEAYMYLLRDSNATGECVATRGGHHLI
ncbi:oxidoreductase [Poronia punctata]|nr:oxidoreductase [Poronia punctata]